MPFTPIHLGAGLALKAVGGRRFSLIGFGLTQIAVDIEPLLGLIHGWDVLHGRSHSLLGATVIAAAVTPLTRALGPPSLRVADRWLAAHGLAGWCEPPDIGWTAAAAGCLLGAWSHALMDAVMHADLQLLWPWSSAQPFYGIASTTDIEIVSAAAALAGIAVWIARALRRGRSA
ncbi:DUF4184 family protein [Tahibacter caeni]|uniref:DUF4184 family protein n=1 Tax=Tahibacter caeni TaxID=1453545 RepID=UPI002149663C